MPLLRPRLRPTLLLRPIKMPGRCRPARQTERGFKRVMRRQNLGISNTCLFGPHTGTLCCCYASAPCGAAGEGPSSALLEGAHVGLSRCPGASRRTSSAGSANACLLSYRGSRFALRQPEHSCQLGQRLMAADDRDRSMQPTRHLLLLCSPCV